MGWQTFVDGMARLACDVAVLLAPVVLVAVLQLIQHYAATLKDARLRSIIDGAVRSAEQRLGAGQGVAKLQLAKAHVAVSGVAADPQVLEDLIEAAVHELTRMAPPREVVAH